MPYLSIIVPVYNTAPYLRLCLESILSQSFHDFELICVDNRSTDGSSDILKECAAEDGRVKYFVTEKHGRAAESRQFGLSHASGAFITYVDSDDSVKPGMYEHMCREQAKHSADIVVCNYDIVSPGKVTPDYSDMRDEVIKISDTGYPDYFTRYFCMRRPNNYLWSRIIRRGIAVEHGIAFQPVDISEDTIFTMLCTAFADTAVHIGKAYYNYFQREDSTMRLTIRKKNIAASYVYAFDCVDRYVNSHGLGGVFYNIMPVYAATRVRSMLFYLKLVGSENAVIAGSLRTALSGSSLPVYLRRAVTEQLIGDDELSDSVEYALNLLGSPV